MENIFRVWRGDREGWRGWIFGHPDAFSTANKAGNSWKFMAKIRAKAGKSWKFFSALKRWILPKTAIPCKFRTFWIFKEKAIKIAKNTEKAPKNTENHGFFCGILTNLRRWRRSKTGI